jgi:hypothetical protein
MLSQSIDCNSVAESILHIINTSLLSGIVPDKLKQSTILPLVKVKNPSSPGYLRPISIQPVLGKIIEKAV